MFHSQHDVAKMCTSNMHTNQIIFSPLHKSQILHALRYCLLLLASLTENV